MITAVKKIRSHKGIPIRLASLVFALWMSGLGCLVGCAPMLFGADRAATSSSHACCHHSKSADVNERLTEALGVSTCCPLAGQVGAFSNVKRLQRTSSFYPATSFLQGKKTAIRCLALPSQQVRVPDRHGTHLLNCTLLI